MKTSNIFKSAFFQLSVFFTIIMFFILFTLRRDYLAVEPVDFIAVSEYTSEEILDDLSFVEQSYLTNYEDYGMTIYMADNVLTYSNTVYDDFVGTTLLQDFISDFYGINATVTSDSKYMTSADIVLTDDVDLFPSYMFDTSFSSNTIINAYSSSRISSSLFQDIKDGVEFKIIAPSIIWDYLDAEFPSHNLLDAFDGETVNSEDILNNLLECADCIAIVSESNVEFYYAFEKYEYETGNEIYSFTLDMVYNFFGSKDSEKFSLNKKLFGDEWLTMYRKYARKKTYSIIFTEKVTSLNDSLEGFSDYINSIDTVYFYIPDKIYPLNYQVGEVNYGYMHLLVNAYNEVFADKFEVIYSLDDANGSENIIYFNVNDTDENREKFSFTDFYFENYYSVVSNSDSNRYTALSLISGTVAFPSELKSFIQLFDEIDEENIILCDTETECINFLNTGKADYMIMNTDNLTYYNFPDISYYTNYSFKNNSIKGYVTISNDHSQDEFLIELLEMLYPLVDHETKMNSAISSFSLYVENYTIANTKTDHTTFVVGLYFVIMFVIGVSVLLEYRKNSAIANEEITKLVDVANVGIVKIDSLSNICILNHTLLTLLEIEDYTQQSTKDLTLFSVSFETFTNTIQNITTRNNKDITSMLELQNIDGIISEMMIGTPATITHTSVKNNKKVFLKYSVNTNISNDGFVSAIVTDVTSINNEYRLVQEIAYIDPLTKVYNFSKLSSDFESEKFLMYLTINIKQFRFYNDLYGLDFADRILFRFAEKISNELSTCKADINLYRVHADYFVILIDSFNTEIVKMLAARLEESASTVKIASQHEVRLQVKMSAGNMNYHKYGKVSDFINELLLRIKMSNNSNELFISDQEFEKANLESNLISEIFTLKNFDDFNVYLQPKVDPVTNKCLGAESLIRWIHPKIGFIAPLLFLDRFENAGRMFDLDCFVIDQSCKHLKELQEQNLVDDDFILSFNLSSYGVINHDFAQKIIDSVEKYKIDYRNLGAEVLENINLESHPQVVESLTKLHDLGLNVSIDDYGSGYSNLYTVQLLPYAKLKIDKSIVDDIDKNKNKKKLFTDLINMLRKMGNDIMCEGVETKEQVDIVSKSGIREIQGYYYSKPLEFTDFKEFIK